MPVLLAPGAYRRNEERAVNMRPVLVAASGCCSLPGAYRRNEERAVNMRPMGA